MAVWTFKGFLSTVDPDVLLQMVLEFECLATLWTLELAQVCAFVMTDHVPLQTVNISKGLVADFTGLRGGGVGRQVLVQKGLLHEDGLTLRTLESDGLVWVGTLHVIFEDR